MQLLTVLFYFLLTALGQVSSMVSNYVHGNYTCTYLPGWSPWISSITNDWFFSSSVLWITLSSIHSVAIFFLKELRYKDKSCVLSSLFFHSIIHNQFYIILLNIKCTYMEKKVEVFKFYKLCSCYSIIWLHDCCIASAFWLMTKLPPNAIYFMIISPMSYLF